MKIDEMTVAIRPMTTQHAVDLGFMMARQWFFPLWKIWLSMALPVFLLVYIGTITVTNLMLDGDNELLKNSAIFVFWFLKPIYEKPIVSWLGSALFSERLDVKSVIKTGWKSALSYGSVLLFVKRLSFHRQLIMPILLLERPDNQQFYKRLRLLRRGQGGGLTWFTLIMVHVEIVIAFGVLLFLSQLVPKSLMSNESFLSFITSMPVWIEYLWAVIYFLCLSIVAPFFVCAGFAVYLTKRCLLEGWDIELVFKQLSARYQQSQSNSLQKLQSQTRPVQNLQQAQAQAQSQHQQELGR